MPDRYGDDYRPHGARLDIGGLPVCDRTHPQCCADIEAYRQTRDRQREARKTS